MSGGRGGNRGKVSGAPARGDARAERVHRKAPGDSNQKPRTPHPEALFAQQRASKDGQQAPRRPPSSFETRPAGAPQDEGEHCRLEKSAAAATPRPPVASAAAADDRADALALVPVSRETERRLALYVDLLSRWSAITDLIAPASFQHVWTRHIADSAQLLALAPNARRWVDLGTGAGFPGLVLAIQLADTPGAKVHLIESDKRKCAFLREVARETGAPANVHPVRAESPEAQGLTSVDAVTARAFAPLPRLMDFAKVFLAQGAVGIFPRGRSVESQIGDLSEGASFAIEARASRVAPEASILIVRHCRGATIG